MNRLPRVAAKPVVFALFASLLSATAAAQGRGSVVESQGVTLGGTAATTPTSQTTAPGSNNDALQLLLDQNRQLQAELQALRGMVEEQGFEIRRLQRDSLSRYTDVDERLQSLESGAVSAPASNATVSASNPPVAVPTTGRGNSLTAATTPNANAADTANSAGATSGSSRPTLSSRNTRTPASRGTLQPAVFSEQQLYQMAYDSVINSNFERSIAEFDQYLSIYPQGRFITNAHYWKGQAYLFLNRYTEARDSYEIILNDFQDSAKLPDAMYGLAQAYEGLGNVPQARQLLNDIKRQFPNTGAASLADTRLLTLD